MSGVENQLLQDFFTWRKAVLRSELPPTTRHLLLTLSCYVSDMGTGVYPSTRRLAQDTGLSERSICTHIDVATEQGWIAVRPHGFSGKGWKRHEYALSFPASVIPKLLGTETGSAPSAGSTNEGTETGSAAIKQGAEGASVPTNQGTEPGDGQALNVVQSKSPEEDSRLREEKNLSPARATHRDGPPEGWEPDRSLVETRMVAGGMKPPWHADQLQAFLAHYRSNAPPPRFNGNWNELFVKWLIGDKGFRRENGNGAYGAGGKRNTGPAVIGRATSAAFRELTPEDAG